jgi:hypothetical protein
MKDLQHEINLLGHRKVNEWECFKFNVLINGQEFDYHVGMGHAKKMEDKQGFNLSMSELKKIKDQGYTLKSSYPENRCNIVGNCKVFQVSVLVKAPKIEDILNSLFLDSDALEYSFEDWCDNYGYSNDSIKAEGIYKECIKTAHKLKKALGNKYSEVKAEIDALEL